MRQRLLPHNALLFTERLTVSALVLSGVHLMGTHQDPVQGAIILVFAVVCTLLDGAFDALVGMTVHKKASFEIGFADSMAHAAESMLEKVSKVAFWKIL